MSLNLDRIQWVWICIENMLNFSKVWIYNGNVLSFSKGGGNSLKLLVSYERRWHSSKNQSKYRISSETYKILIFPLFIAFTILSHVVIILYHNISVVHDQHIILLKTYRWFFILKIDQVVTLLSINSHQNIDQRTIFNQSFIFLILNCYSSSK